MAIKKFFSFANNDGDKEIGTNHDSHVDADNGETTNMTHEVIDDPSDQPTPSSSDAVVTDGLITTFTTVSEDLIDKPKDITLEEKSNIAEDSATLRKAVKAKEILSKRLKQYDLYSPSEIRALLTADRANLVKAAKLLDLETVSNSRLTALSKEIAEALRSKKSLEQNRDDDVPGEVAFSDTVLLLYYKLITTSVAVPVETIRTINSANADRLLTLFNLALQRIQSIGALPYDAVTTRLSSILAHDKRLADQLREFVAQDGDDVFTASTNIPSDLSYADVADIVKALTPKAAEKYIISNILQPNFRSVISSTCAFKWLNFEEIADLATRHARWHARYLRGSLQNALALEILRDLQAEEHTPGLVNMSGVASSSYRSNLVYLLRELQTVPGVVQTEDEGANSESSSLLYVDFGSDQDVETGAISQIKASLGNVSVTTCQKLSDISGMPALISDEIALSAGEDINPTKELLINCIGIYAALTNTKVADKVDMAMLYIYPEWKGLLMSGTNGTATIDLAEVVRTLPQWMQTLVTAKFYVNVLNGAIPSSPLGSLFTDINSSDMSLETLDRLAFYNLASQTLLEIIQFVLGAFRKSREWSGSAVWDILQKVIAIPHQEADDTKYKRVVHRRLTSRHPIIVKGTSTLSISKYFLDEKLADYPKAMHAVLENLKQLGVLGSMEQTTSYHYTYNIIGNAGYVDIYMMLNKIAEDPQSVPSWYINKIMESAEVAQPDDIDKIRQSTSMRVTVSALNGETIDIAPGVSRLLRGTALLSPSPVVRYATVVSGSYEDHIPLAPAHVPSNQRYDEDINLVTPMYRELIKPVDPTSYFVVDTKEITIDLDMPSVYVPTSIDEAQTLVQSVSVSLLDQGDVTLDGME